MARGPGRWRRATSPSRPARRSWPRAWRERSTGASPRSDRRGGGRGGTAGDRRGGEPILTAPTCSPRTGRASLQSIGDDAGPAPARRAVNEVGCQPWGCPDGRRGRSAGRSALRHPRQRAGARGGAGGARRRGRRRPPDRRRRRHRPAPARGPGAAARAAAAAALGARQRGPRARHLGRHPARRLRPRAARRLRGDRPARPRPARVDAVLPRLPAQRRGDPDARHQRRAPPPHPCRRGGAGGGVRPHARAVRPHPSTERCEWSTPAASACPTRTVPAPTGRARAPVELRRTAFDLDAAAARIRASTWPGAAEFAAENVLTVPTGEEATELFETRAVALEQKQ